MEQQPTICFEIGGFNGGCFQVEYKDGKLQYRQAEGAYIWEPAIILQPDLGAWERFWKALEIAGVWQWNERYENLDVDDGTQWSLELKYQGRSINTSGSNAYPGCNEPSYSKKCAFGQFIKALQDLTGKQEIR